MTRARISPLGSHFECCPLWNVFLYIAVVGLHRIHNISLSLSNYHNYTCYNFQDGRKIQKGRQIEIRAVCPLYRQFCIIVISVRLSLSVQMAQC